VESALRRKDRLKCKIEQLNTVYQEQINFQAEIRNERAWLLVRLEYAEELERRKKQQQPPRESLSRAAANPFAEYAAASNSRSAAEEGAASEADDGTGATQDDNGEESLQADAAALGETAETPDDRDPARSVGAVENGPHFDHVVFGSASSASSEFSDHRSPIIVRRLHLDPEDPDHIVWSSSDSEAGFAPKQHL
jgi:hypothetical protein